MYKTCEHNPLFHATPAPAVLLLDFHSPGDRATDVVLRSCYLLVLLGSNNDIVRTTGMF